MDKEIQQKIAKLEQDISYLKQSIFEKTPDEDDEFQYSSKELREVKQHLKNDRKQLSKLEEKLAKLLT